MQKEALVKNAASEKQVKQAAHKEQRSLADFEQDLKAILDLPEGRRFIWEVLSQSGIYRSPYAHSGSQQAVNIGRGEIGRWLLAKIVEVDQKYWLQMQNENLNRGDIDA